MRVNISKKRIQCFSVSGYFFGGSDRKTRSLTHFPEKSPGGGKMGENLQFPGFRLFLMKNSTLVKNIQKYLLFRIFRTYIKCRSCRITEQRFYVFSEKNIGLGTVDKSWVKDNGMRYCCFTSHRMTIVQLFGIDPEHLSGVEHIFS